jgi:hypothetical protein
MAHGNPQRRTKMVDKSKKNTSQKKRRIKVGKLETAKELSAAEAKEVRGGDKASGKVQVHEIQVAKTTDQSSAS